MARLRGRPRLPRVQLEVPRDALVAFWKLLQQQLGKPGQIRRNPFILRYLARYADPEIDDNFLARSIEEMLRSSCSRVAPRARIIIERTIFGGEPISAVATSLGISERQLYRDRAAAVVTMANQLASTSADSRFASVSIEEPVALQLAYARVLEQIARYDEASCALSDLARNIEAPRKQAFVQCALARVALAQSRKHAAHRHVENALTLLRADDDPPTRAEAESMAGAIAMIEGDLSAAHEKLRRSVVAQRSLVECTGQIRCTEALVRSLITHSDLNIFMGRFQDGCDAAAEAQRRILALPFGDRALALSARVSVAAAASFIGESPFSAETEMRNCYEAAVRQGFVAIAVDVGIWLALIYRFRQQHDRALELFNSLLPTSRSFSPSALKANFFIAMANELSEVGRPKAAIAMVSEAATIAVPDDPGLQAQLSLSSARAYLAANESLAAADAADQARRLFSELGLSGLVGVSLLIKGRALASSGRLRDAVTNVRQSIDALSVAGHPQALHDAQHTLALLGRSRCSNVTVP